MILAIVVGYLTYLMTNSMGWAVALGVAALVISK